MSSASPFLFYPLTKRNRPLLKNAWKTSKICLTLVPHFKKQIMRSMKKFSNNQIKKTIIVKGGNRDKKYKSKSGTISIDIYESGRD